MQQEAMKQKAAGPEAAGPETTKSEAAKPEAAEPEIAEPEAAKPEIAEPGKNRRRTTPRQIAAIIAIVLLVLLYLSTLIAALFDSTSSGTFFRLSLIGTFTIPLITWVYIWMYGKLTGKHSMADPPEEGGAPEKDDTPTGSGSLKGTKP